MALKKLTNGRSFWRSQLPASLFLIIIIAVMALAVPGPINPKLKALGAKIGLQGLQLPDPEYKLGLDLNGGAHLIYTADLSSLPVSDQQTALEGVRDVLERRINSFGVTDPVVQAVTNRGSSKIIIDLPGVSDVKEAIAQLGETPVLNFRTPDKEISFEPTPEQTEEINTNQARERALSQELFTKAIAGEDWNRLVQEYSVDESTKSNAGKIGFISVEDEEYGGLIQKIIADRIKPGILGGIYEGVSRLHLVDYLSNKEEPQISASQILICYAGASNCENARSKDDALALATSTLSTLTTKNFKETATTISDDTATQTTGGELGFLSIGEVDPAIESVLNTLKNNSINKEVVETSAGFHLIYRTGSRTETLYELAHIELPWTTLSDVFVIDPWQDTALSGRHIKSASVAFDQTTNQPLISLDFNSEGSDLFGELTEANIGKQIGIFLDGEAITTPTVQQAIYGGQATITGTFTIAEAKLLAQRLNAGALPVPVKLVSQATIGPALGQESLAAGIKAGLIGFALVALFMIIYYRLPGLLAIFSLIFYIGANLLAYRLFGVTITLPGMAGLVLSIGIAVDANVLIFERLKEELQAGKDLLPAVKESFRRAWPSIRDGNFTTLIATAVLYGMSSGFIRGFALTLSIGILISIFSAMVITKAFMMAASRWRPKHRFLILGSK